MNKQPQLFQETEVIELRQRSKKSTSYNNADYRTDLEREIYIKEGDVVKIKSVFVDSVALNSDKIQVLPDVPETDPNYENATELERNFKKLSTQHNVFYRNWGYSYEPPNTQRDYSVNANPIIDGKDYVACMSHVKGGGVVAVNVTGIKFQFVRDNHASKFQDPCHMNLQYETIGGVIKYLHLLVPRKSILKQDRLGEGNFILDANTKLSSDSHAVNFPLLCKQNTIQISEQNDRHQDTNKTQLHQGGLKRDSDDQDIEVVDPSVNFLEPMTFPQDFYLRAGNYNKKELSRELTVLFSQFSKHSGHDQGVLNPKSYDVFASGQPYPNDLNGNTFLLSSNALRLTRGDGISVGTDGDTNGRCFFSRTDGKNAFKFKKENLASNPIVSSYWVGSDEGIAIDYNEDVDKFEIIQMHMSLRDKNSNSICVGAQPTEDGTEYLVINNKLTGIYLQNLEPQDFWFGSSGLNFDKSILVQESSVKLEAGTEYPLWDDATQRTVPFIGNLEDGINTTGDLMTNAVITFKGNQSSRFDPHNSVPQANGGLAFDVSSPPLSFNVATAQTMSIYADTNNGVANTDDHEEKGYFKIEVDMGINNSIVGGENNSRVKSIINRFYTVDSYTSSYGEGDITYQHKGETPLKISDIGVRILKPDGSLSTEIGDANSVFLEIIRPK